MKQHFPISFWYCDIIPDMKPYLCKAQGVYLQFSASMTLLPKLLFIEISLNLKLSKPTSLSYDSMIIIQRQRGTQVVVRYKCGLLFLFSINTNIVSVEQMQFTTAVTVGPIQSTISNTKFSIISSSMYSPLIGILL